MKTFINKYLRINFVPSALKIKTLLNKCETIFEGIECQSQILESIKKEFKGFKENKIRLTNEELDEEDWKGRDKTLKRELYAELKFIYKQLRACNRKELCLGTTFFVLVLILLVGSFGGYLYLHEKASPSENHSKKDKISTEDLIDIQKEVNIMYTLVRQSDGNNNMEKIKDTLLNIKSYLSCEPLSSKSTFGLKKYFGILSGEIETGGLTIESVRNFSELLDAEIKAINTTFFWRTTPKKWCEIVFWAYCGVIVGILFYVAGLLETGIFPREILPMILTEIIITPPVVLIIFFLFPISGLTNIIPSESSIHMSIGIAFILGFAIRRTVGLLDTIKRRMLPDPPLPTGDK